MNTWQFSYYNAKVQANVEAWPDGVLASFRHIARLMVDHGPNLGLPYTRAMGSGLLEIRAKGPEGIGRAFYCTLTGQHIVILHAIRKKTQRTPPHELAIARARMKEVKA